MSNANGCTSLHLRRAREGDGTSSAWIVDRFTPLLLAQARYRIGARVADLCEPEDLVQETWIVALQRLSTLREREGRLTPVLLRFLATTQLQLLRNHRRRHARRAARTPGLDRGASPAEAPANQAGPSTHVDARCRLDAVQVAIESLPKLERAVVVLRGIEQLDNRTVAELLGLTPNATSLRYARALRRLRRALPGSVVAELQGTS